MFDLRGPGTTGKQDAALPQVRGETMNGRIDEIHVRGTHQSINAERRFGRNGVRIHKQKGSEAAPREIRNFCS